MRKYSKYLIDFMQKKHDKINEKMTADYFNNKDKEAIEKWSTRKAKEIWETITDHIYSGRRGLDGGLCPFCLYYNYTCLRCRYAKNGHGACNDGTTNSSSYRKIVDTINIDRVLSNEYYLDIIIE